jgi:mRNA interferase MazF
VVVSSDTVHRESADVVIMAITTQTRRTSTLEVSISRWQEAGLLRPSVVKPVLATVERNLVFKHIGRLQDIDRKALRDSLRSFLG